MPIRSNTDRIVTLAMLEIQPRLFGACSITIGDVELTPAASHLFALLLALTLAPSGTWTRRGLQELLFAGTVDRLATHRLRQLLYRLRTFGVEVDEANGGVLRLVNAVADVVGAPDVPAHWPDAGSLGPAVGPLTHYSPRLPAPYLDWLEQARDALQRQHVARQMAQLRGARERHDWESVARLADLLREQDSLNEELAIASAEAHAVLGRRDAAVAVIDRFIGEAGEDIGMRPELRKLRTRILSTRVGRREGTLRGREECLAFLAGQWERTISGEGGRACILLGAPGMGKSRIGETLSSTVRVAGGQVLTYRCDSQTRQFPLAIFSQLVPDLRRRRGSIGADPALASALDHLSLSDTAIRHEAVSPGSRREELRRAIVDLLESVSSEQPMLIVIDDAQLLDDASRGVIRALADSNNTAQVLVALLCRPRPDGNTLLGPANRVATYVLPPLTEDDSRALLLELAGPGRINDPQVGWVVAQAAGNPFYLHALAQHPCEQVTLPAHVRSLAHTSYLGLSTAARDVLDCCLLLDTLATPARVSTASAVHERELLGALRELEDSDLLRYDDGLFLGPHAIVREALFDIMPSTGRAILHRRIATLLSAECMDFGQTRDVASSAVGSWLAAGDPLVATELALHLARHADSVGEPESGAVLLSRLPYDQLSIAIRREVMDEIIRLADAGKCPNLLERTVKERTALAVYSGENADRIAELTIRSLTCDHPNGHSYDVVMLQSIVRNKAISAGLRAEAASTLFSIADLYFDSALANTTLNDMAEVLPQTSPSFAPVLRAHLIYHTAFGDQRRALTLIQELLSLSPSPSLDEEGRRSRSWVVLALLRLGYYSHSAQLAETECTFMMHTGHLSAAEYIGALAIEAYICIGDLVSARSIYAALEHAVRSRHASEPWHSKPHYSSTIMLALSEHNYTEVTRLIGEAEAVHGGLAAPRLRSAILSSGIRVKQLRDNLVDGAHELDELESLFKRGKRSGAQDDAAEVLWHAYVARGDQAGASMMLEEYLRHRREDGPAGANLRASTASDTIWRSYSPLRPYLENPLTGAV